MRYLLGKDLLDMALHDLYAAQAFVAEAQRLGRGTQLDTSRG
jgi:hypothetical protein